MPFLFLENDRYFYATIIQSGLRKPHNKVSLKAAVARSGVTFKTISYINPTINPLLKPLIQTSLKSNNV